MTDIILGTTEIAYPVITTPLHREAGFFLQGQQRLRAVKELSEIIQPEVAQVRSKPGSFGTHDPVVYSRKNQEKIGSSVLHTTQPHRQQYFIGPFSGSFSVC